MNKIGFFLFLSAFLMPQGVWAQTVSKTVRISFEIEPVTKVKISSEAGVSAVRLGPISPHAKIPTQILTVSVMTNTKNRYQIYHELKGNVISEGGDQFPPQQLLFMATDGEKGGKSETRDFTPVPPGEVTIFTSRSEGGPDTFQVLYSIDNNRLFPAGTYYGDINIDIRTE